MAVAAFICALTSLVSTTAQAASGAPNFVLKWGSSGSAEGEFRNPAGIAIDPSGRVLVADQSNYRIQVFTGDGAFVSAHGSQGEGPGQFTRVADVAVDPLGNIYVLDAFVPSRIVSRVQKFDSGWNFLLAWDLPRPRGASSIALSPDGTNVYVSWGRGVITYSATGDSLNEWDHLAIPNDALIASIAVAASGNVYEVDFDTDEILKYSPHGVLLGVFSGYGGGDGQLANPVGIAVDGSERIYVTDSNNRCQLFDPAGQFIASWGVFGSGDGEFGYAGAVGIDVQGSIYIVDAGYDRIQKFAFTATPARTSSWGELKARFR